MYVCIHGNIPCVANAYNMVDITQGELEELVREDARGVSEAEQRVIGEDGPQSHGPSM